MNDKRTMPYAFRVFARDGWAWLYDDSERTYICSQQANVWAEPLYFLGEEGAHGEDDIPDPDYFAASHRDPIEGSIPTREVPATETETDAWDQAREHAQGNHYL